MKTVNDIRVFSIFDSKMNEFDEYNTLIQAEATIKSMICVKRLMNIIERKISKIKLNN
jgi:hypothetical protein